MDTAPQPRLSDILRSTDALWLSGEQQSQPGLRQQQTLLAAEAEWRAAIAALRGVLQRLPRSTQGKGHERTAADKATEEGIILSGPLPVLGEADLGQRFTAWVATPQPLAEALNGSRSLLPAAKAAPHGATSSLFRALPLTLQSPLLTERFCLVATSTFSLVLVLGQPVGDAPCLQYSFEPQIILRVWQAVRAHITAAGIESADTLEKWLWQTVEVPDYRWITRFTQQLMVHLPHRLQAAALTVEAHGDVRLGQWLASPSSLDTTEADSVSTTTSVSAATPSSPSPPTLDTELLKAMAHEIRTPLTTIRTLVRSLLRRKDLTREVKRRLSRVDQECTQQIDRFNLIFRAVELESMESDRPRSTLTPTALTQLLQESIPRWQQQAHRRNLSLDVTLPPDLPRVTSDPTLLNEVLTGVVEWFTQCLPPQSHIQMRVMLAGHQLKLQFEADPTSVTCPHSGNAHPPRPSLKSLGQVLMVAPETGGLSLNLDATKNLFEFLGGKLIVRQRPQQGDVLTVFLPLDPRDN